MDDLISRRVAIDAFRKELCREREYATPFISLNGCERILNELPSAERRGRWIAEDDDGSWSSAVCSVCGRRVGLAHYETDFAKHFPYCHCGASMMDDNAIQHTKCVGNALDALDEVEE